MTSSRRGQMTGAATLTRGPPRLPRRDVPPRGLSGACSPSRCRRSIRRARSGAAGCSAGSRAGVPSWAAQESLRVAKGLDDILAVGVVTERAHREPRLAEIGAHRTREIEASRTRGSLISVSIIAEISSRSCSPTRSRRGLRAPSAKGHAFCCSIVNASRMSPSWKSLKSASVMPQS